MICKHNGRRVENNRGTFRYDHGGGYGFNRAAYQKLTDQASRDVKLYLREWPTCSNGGVVTLAWMQATYDDKYLYTAFWSCTCR